MRTLEVSGEAEWDEFVREHPLGTPFHLIAWKKCLEENFPFRAEYLVAFDGDLLKGVLPLFLVDNWLVGKALVSTPVAPYGGALATTQEAFMALRDALANRAQEIGVQYAELRNVYAEQSLGFERVTRHVIYMGPLEAGEEKLLESIPRKTRRIVRKSLEEKFITRVETENPARFEDLYCRNLRRLGTPPYPRRFMRSLLKNFRGSVDIREVYLEGKLVSAVLNLYFGKTVLPSYGAADPAYNAHAPSTFMYYDLMRVSAAAGYETYDFGKSKIETGSGHFKSHWGLKELPLHYEILLVKRKQLPNYTPTNPKYQLAIRMWRWLPLWVTRMIGPPILKRLP
ncbi:MAG: FemAB family PEP-CTERM system-associated protein [Acidobacteriia bacterium]|nr:FemAB family PEP-CTERM system-associated protein [Terriglobia bacterium]